LSGVSLRRCQCFAAEINDVDRWDAVAVQGNVIVVHLRPFVVDERPRLLLLGDLPDLLDEQSRRPVGIRLDRERRPLSADHVEQDRGEVLVLRLAALVADAEVLRSEEVLIALVKDVLLAIEEDKIHADGRVDFLEVVGKLHEQGNTTAAVVGADERFRPLARVGFLIGQRSCVVVRAGG
jgi:hypothetical protein